MVFKYNIQHQHHPVSPSVNIIDVFIFYSDRIMEPQQKQKNRQGGITISEGGELKRVALVIVDHMMQDLEHFRSVVM